MKFAKLHDFLKKPYLLALVVVVVLIKLPPFYIVSGMEKSNSFNLIRVCILFSFFAVNIINKRGQNILRRINPILLFMLIGYLLTQTISIIPAINITAFLNAYKDLVIGLFLLFTILLITKEDAVILIKAFFISATVGTFYQLIFISFPSVIEIIRPFFNTTYMQFVDYQSSRGRYFGDTLDEALIPIIFYYFSRTKKIEIKILLISISLPIIFLVVLSGWRTKFIILLYAMVGTLLIYKQIKKYLLIILLILVLAFAISNNLSIKLVGQNVFDRLLSDDPVEMHIEKNRIIYLKNAFEVGLSHPINGAGLGNFYDNLSEVSRRANQKPDSIYYTSKFILVDDPHNLFFSVFATSGIFGLISISSMLLYFFITDLTLFKRGYFEKSLPLVFWGYFIFAFFNPWMNLSFLVPFWFFRGVIENIKLNK